MTVLELIILLVAALGGSALICTLFSRAMINTVKKYDAERKAKKELDAKTANAN